MARKLIILWCLIYISTSVAGVYYNTTLTFGCPDETTDPHMRPITINYVNSDLNCSAFSFKCIKCKSWNHPLKCKFYLHFLNITCVPSLVAPVWTFHTVRSLKPCNFYSKQCYNCTDKVLTNEEYNYNRYSLDLSHNYWYDMSIML
jgi:hypothetical protein